MSEIKRLARIILRPDGDIHIAFSDITTIHATANNLMSLFSDPMEFIANERNRYAETTDKVNRKRVRLEEILGLTLASINEDKQLVCDFPELFKYLFMNADTEEKRERPIIMRDYAQLMVMADEKAFLLRFYLEFTRNLKSRVAIKRNIKLRDEVQFAIIREILNTYFDDALPKPEPRKELSKQIEQVEDATVYQPPQPAEANIVTLTEYGAIHDLSKQTIYKYIREKRFKSVIQETNGRYFLDKTEEPPNIDRRKNRKRKNFGEDAFFKRAVESSPEEVRKYIQDRNLFSDDIGRFILTFNEVDYYIKHYYHEVNWSGRPALIIDVNPDYIVPPDKVPQQIKDKFDKDPTVKVRNRDLMKAGFAPVVPDKTKEKYNFEIHHIGQKANSPFCVIPKYDHQSKDLTSIFHQGTPDKELDRSVFEAQKKSFWKEYIREYDKAGSFKAIPYLNHKKDWGYANGLKQK